VIKKETVKAQFCNFQKTLVVGIQASVLCYNYSKQKLINNLTLTCIMYCSLFLNQG